jgi:hypothetical protein
VGRQPVPALGNRFLDFRQPFSETSTIEIGEAASLTPPSATSRPPIHNILDQTSSSSPTTSLGSAAAL